MEELDPPDPGNENCGRAEVVTARKRRESGVEKCIVMSLRVGLVGWRWQELGLAWGSIYGKRKIEVKSEKNVWPSQRVSSRIERWIERERLG